jgi:hypothetical protein
MDTLYNMLHREKKEEKRCQEGASESFGERGSWSQIRWKKSKERLFQYLLSAYVKYINCLRLPVEEAEVEVNWDPLDPGENTVYCLLLPVKEAEVEVNRDPLDPVEYTILSIVTNRRGWSRGQPRSSEPRGIYIVYCYQ